MLLPMMRPHINIYKKKIQKEIQKNEKVEKIKYIYIYIYQLREHEVHLENRQRLVSEDHNI